MSDSETRPIRLSEAIRLGAMLHPQCFGAATRFRNGRGQFCRPWGGVRSRDKVLQHEEWENGHVAATCAVEAAYQAGFTRPQLEQYQNWRVRCPKCEAFTGRHRRADLLQMLAHLNDHHRCSREWIAGWLDIVETLHASALRGVALGHRGMRQRQLRYYLCRAGIKP